MILIPGKPYPSKELVSNLDYKAIVMATQRKKKALIKLMQEQYPDYDKMQLRAFIDCRQVIVDGETCVDSQAIFPENSVVGLNLSKYVSRGALKLEHALTTWNIDISGLVFVDAGSSTGGFTDCLLQSGARAVHAVDVGYNQLDYRLRTDARVIVHERQNIMQVEQLDPRPDAAVADLSFRSITGAASHILSLTKDSWLISLIKPQFEIPKGTDGFSGVVDDGETIKEILFLVYAQLATENVGIEAIIESPIQGRKGNREFLALLKPGLRMDESVYRNTIELLIGVPQ